MYLTHYRHFYLYAKRHYQWSNDGKNVIDDLRKIISAYSGCKAEHVRDADVMVLIRSVIEECIKLCYKGDNKVLINALFETQRTYASYEWLKLDYTQFSTPTGFLIGVFLTLVCLAPVRENNVSFIELGEPDPTILPLKQPYVKEQA